MLALINDVREEAGADPVTLGDNNAAQTYAEIALTDCTDSYWGLDGLMPQVRYSLAGGYQLIHENRWIRTYCASGQDEATPVVSVEEEIRQAMEYWLSYQNFSSVIESEHASRVNIGLAWEGSNLVAVQLFEEDLVEFEQPPAIANGILSMSGVVSGGIYFEDTQDLELRIHYSQPPEPITAGQAYSSWHCRTPGIEVSVISTKARGTVPVTEHPCEPLDEDRSLPAPRSRADERSISSAALHILQGDDLLTRQIPILAPHHLAVHDPSFDLKADLRGVIAEYGRGIYTAQVYVRGRIISQYSIFHGIAAPDAYRAIAFRPT